METFGVEWDELLEKPFDPCVIVYDDPKRTEMLLRDTAIVWCFVVGNPDLELGYDLIDGDLVAIRVSGDVSTRR